MRGIVACLDVERMVAAGDGTDGSERWEKGVAWSSTSLGTQCCGWFSYRLRVPCCSCRRAEIDLRLESIWCSRDKTSSPSLRGRSSLLGPRYTHSISSFLQKLHDGLAASHRVLRRRHTSHWRAVSLAIDHVKEGHVLRERLFYEDMPDCQSYWGFGRERASLHRCRDRPLIVC